MTKRKRESSVSDLISHVLHECQEHQVIVGNSKELATMRTQTTTNSARQSMTKTCIDEGDVTFGEVGKLHVVCRSLLAARVENEDWSQASVFHMMWNGEVKVRIISKTLLAPIVENENWLRSSCAHN